MRRSSAPSLVGLAVLVAIATSGLALGQGRRRDRSRQAGDASLTGPIGPQAENDAAPLPVPAFSISPSTGATAVATDRGFLFVARGDVVYKLDETSLAVVATGRLGPPAAPRRSQNGLRTRRRPVSSRPKEGVR